MSSIIQYILKRKVLSGVIALLLIAGGYFGYTKIFSTDGAIRYVTAQVQNGTLIVSISGSGQVSASNQVDVKPKASGDIVYVGVKNGQEVKAGTLIAQLDSRDAQKAVRDAEINLEQVKLELEKMKGMTTDEGTIRGIKEKAVDNLKKAYEDGIYAVTNIFLELPGTMTGLQDMLFSYTLSKTQWNIDYYVNEVQNYDPVVFQFRDDVNVKYREARQAYDKNFMDYKSTSRFPDTETTERLIDQTYETAKLVAETIKATNNLIQLYKDKLTERNLKPNALADTHLSQLSTYTGKTNSYLSNLFSIKNTIQNNREAIVNVSFDIADQEIRVAKAEDSLLEVKEKLANYFIYASFSGLITKVNVKKGDSVSPSTNLGTLVTKQKVAEISLNEIDVAKVKTGQKATLTFDAVPDLTITGQVAEVDAVGTVSQGVVTYTVKIAFDTQDERVKPSMSVSAAIITEAKPNTLLVPNSALKSQSNTQYVEIVEGNDRDLALAANSNGIILKNSPRRQSVEIGIANDEFTEILNGLKEGDLIVTRIIQPTAAQPTQQQSGGLRIPGLNTGGTSGGGLRGGGR